MPKPKPKTFPQAFASAYSAIEATNGHIFAFVVGTDIHKRLLVAKDFPDRQGYDRLWGATFTCDPKLPESVVVFRYKRQKLDKLKPTWESWCAMPLYGRYRKKVRLRFG